MARILAGSMVVMLMTSAVPENMGLKNITIQKEHTAYAAVTGYISDYNDLIEATATGGVYVLSNSIVMTQTVTIPKGVDLTLLQETGMNNKITSVKYNDHLFYVKEGASLTLGASDADAVVMDGSNLSEGLNLITVEGTINIENADISCPNGIGVVARKGSKLNMNGGHIHDCGYTGILINGEGTIAGGTISNCKYYGVGVGVTATNCKITGGVISNISYYGIQCYGTCTMTGGLITGCDTGVYTTGSSASFTMNGGVISNSVSYALDPYGGAICLTGGCIQNSRCTTRTGSGFYIGGKPYLDDNSFILVREDAPVLQMGNLSAPVINPYAKINLYGLTTEKPLVTAVSEDISLLDSFGLYQSYDRDFFLAVKENQMYIEGTKEIDTKIYPTVRPGSAEVTQQPTETDAVESKAPQITATPLEITAVPPVTGTPMQPSALPETTASIEPSQAPEQPSIQPTVTNQVVVSATPEQTTIQPTVTMPIVATEIPTTTQQPYGQSPVVEHTTEPVATANVYGEFYSSRPEITKISAKGLNFQLQWKFLSSVPADEYAIYCSSDKKNYSLIKTVDGTTANTSVSVSKAYNGQKIYFYVVAKATDAASGNVYQSDKSYVASKYLIDKVMGTTGSYYTRMQKLVVKWKKVSNCTGYSVYIKARCNGKTMTKRCATVSKTKNSVSISSRKIKRRFASNGKPIRIKKYSVRAFYKSGKRTAYSPS